MAKTKHSTAMVPYRMPMAAAPVVIKERTRTVQSKSKKKHHHRSRGISSEKVLMGMALGGYALGFVDKQGTSIPTIPMLGRAGTIALAMHFIGKGKPGLMTDVRNAAAAVAAYEMASTGKISGDDEVDGAV